jgi:hypothetical protein
MSSGASGFGSKLSMWLGPPPRNTKIADFAFAAFASPAAVAWR